MFRSISKEEWLDKVERDLKGRPLDTLDKVLLPGVSYSPFFHREDHQGHRVVLPKGVMSCTQLGADLVINQDEEGHAAIIESLEGGVSYLNITLSDGYRPNLDVLLKEVLLDLIYVDFGSRLPDGLSEWLDEAYEDRSVYVYGNGKDASNRIRPLTKVDVHCTDTLEHDLVAFLSTAASEMKAKMKGQMMAHIALGHDYLLNISVLRALRILWANVVVSSACDPLAYPLMIKAFIPHRILSSDPYQNMISLAHISAAAMMGTADVLFIPSSKIVEDSSTDDFNRRISRNIYHLYTMEGHINKVYDPTAGSYAIDKLTSLIAQKAWETYITEE